MLTKALLETTPKNRDRVKRIAKRNGVTVKQAHTAILDLVLPDIESGKIKIQDVQATRKEGGQ